VQAKQTTYIPDALGTLLRNCCSRAHSGLGGAEQAHSEPAICLLFAILLHAAPNGWWNTRLEMSAEGKSARARKQRLMRCLDDV